VVDIISVTLKKAIKLPTYCKLRMTVDDATAAVAKLTGCLADVDA